MIHLPIDDQNAQSWKKRAEPSDKNEMIPQMHNTCLAILVYYHLPHLNFCWKSEFGSCVQIKLILMENQRGDKNVLGALLQIIVIPTFAIHLILPTISNEHTRILVVLELRGKNNGPYV